MECLAVAAVAVGGGVHPLLVHEHAMAQRQRGVDLLRRACFPDLY